MQPFTVIGYYEESGQRYCSHQIGETWVEAVQSAILEIVEELVIVEVIAGHHAGLTESQQIENSIDFPTAEEEYEPE